MRTEEASNGGYQSNAGAAELIGKTCLLTNPGHAAVMTSATSVSDQGLPQLDCVMLTVMAPDYQAGGVLAVSGGLSRPYLSLRNSIHQ